MRKFSLVQAVRLWVIGVGCWVMAACSPPTPAPQSSLTILFTGDVLLDRGVRHIAEHKGVGYLFEEVTSIFRDADAICLVTCRHGVGAPGWNIRKTNGESLAGVPAGTGARCRRDSGQAHVGSALPVYQWIHTASHHGRGYLIPVGETIQYEHASASDRQSCFGPG